jgi:hypothetical protein
LSKKIEVPASYQVEPFSVTRALPVVGSFSSSCTNFLASPTNLHVLTCFLFLQNHHTLSSLPPLPEGRDVPERAIINDDSEETSVLASEPAESEKSVGSSDQISESEQVSGSSNTNSTPLAASPDRRKRKRNYDEENWQIKTVSTSCRRIYPPGTRNLQPLHL